MTTYFTDGSCSPNPGPGGYAVILGGEPVVLGSEKKSTNIRMEARALIDALKHSQGAECEIRTDSQLWINIVTLWAPGWEAKGWKKSNGQIKNLELVQEMYELYNNSNAVLVWVKAHVGTEGNELADHWANEARHGKTL